MTNNQIFEIVSKQLVLLNETFLENQKITINENTILFGYGSSIDSLSLVSFIVDLETLFFDEYGFEISLTDDRAMIREISPFDSVATLVDYVFELVNELK